MDSFKAIGLALLILLGTCRAGASPWIYGIHWYGNPGSDDVEAMTGGKPIWLLETVMVHTGGWSMADQAAAFQAEANKGHTIVIRIQPDWGMSIPLPANRQQYLSDLAGVIQQGAAFCRIWQIGNEMNLYDEYGGEVLTADEYITFYKQMRDVIKSVPSPLGEQIVLVGPVSPGAYFNEVRHTDGAIYLQQMAEALGPDDTDGFALHAYGAPWYNADQAVEDFMGGVTSQLSIIDNSGHCDKPAFVLEWNRQTNPPDSATQEAETARFLVGAYRALGQWNAEPGNHPVVCAAWFIYPDYSGWENFSIRNLRDLNPRGVNADLWDSFQSVAAENIAAGSMTPQCPEPTPAPTPTPNLGFIIDRQVVVNLPDFSFTPAADDSLNGKLATRLSGGFHSVVTNPADTEPVFTDGETLGQFTGLIEDFPGAGKPAWSGFWNLDNGNAVMLTDLRVYTGNQGRDGRVFHHYDVYTTTDPVPGAASIWNLLIDGVTSAPFGSVNPGNRVASRTRLTSSLGRLAAGITALRLDFYSVSDTNRTFVDPWDAGDPRDIDGAIAAFESPIVFEVDAWFTTSGATPTPSASPTATPLPSTTATPVATATPEPDGDLLLNGSFEDGFTASGIGIHWTPWQSDWSNPIVYTDSTTRFVDGAHGQCWSFPGTGRFHGGVHQQAAVTPGKPYHLSAWMRREGTASDQWMEFGYDPAGGTLPEGPGVVYTKLEGLGSNQWVHYQATFVALADTVTLFAKGGHYEEDGSANAFYLDSIRLIGGDWGDVFLTY